MSHPDFFDLSMINIHNSPAQLQLQENLSTVKIGHVDKGNNIAIFDYDDGSNIIECRVSLYDCSCPEFQKTQLPCQHMYKLATKLKRFKVERPIRSIKLIADFSDGYAAGWKFAIPTAFRENLDIRLTSRKTNEKDMYGKTIFKDVWTQDHLYNFKIGDIMYNDRIAYEVPWGEAIRKLKFSLQIQKVTPSFNRPVIIIENNMMVNHLMTHYGTIVFDLYKPVKNEIKIEKIDTLECAQDKFVHFLRTGILETSNSTIKRLGDYESIDNAIREQLHIF